jgi:hypothetical protein
MVHGSRQFIGNSPECMKLTIQEDVSKPGGVFQVYLLSNAVYNGEVFDDNNPTHKFSVYPMDINHVIGAALDNGWDPCAKGVFSKLGKPGIVQLQEYVAKGT